MSSLFAPYCHSLPPDSFRDLIAQASSLLEEFCAIYPGGLNHTIDSIERLDIQLASAPQTLTQQDKKLFVLLTAYLGEAIRRFRSGKWEIRHLDTKVWEPWVIPQEGRPIPPFVLVYEQMEPTMFYGFASMVRIWGHQY